MKRLILLIKSLISLFKYIYYSLNLKDKKSNLWIISERGNDARDNGYFLFCYLKRNNPEVNVKYIISSDSSDYNKVKSIGDVIEYRSKEHYIANLQATKLISTHLWGYAADKMAFKAYVKIFGSKSKRISLKHGITKDYIPFLNYKKTMLDMLCCASKYEYDYMLKTYNYTERQLKLTGFARYDNLNLFTTKNQVLVMPTWRKYLGKLSDNVKFKSDFFIKWKSFLKNKRLIDLLEKNSIKLLFYPHYEIQKYISEFESDNKCIIIAGIKEFDVQTLLKESKLLITDYSSVFFDIAYMNKPCLFYQFDKELFFKEHYHKGYFNYEENGFGEVVYNEDKLIDLIEQYIASNYEVKKTYKMRANDFFAYRDNKNCERIFNEIIKL